MCPASVVRMELTVKLTGSEVAAELTLDRVRVFVLLEKEQVSEVLRLVLVPVQVLVPVIYVAGELAPRFPSQVGKVTSMFPLVGRELMGVKLKVQVAAAPTVEGEVDRDATVMDAAIARMAKLELPVALSTAVPPLDMTMELGVVGNVVGGFFTLGTVSGKKLKVVSAAKALVIVRTLLAAEHAIEVKKKEVQG